MAYQELIFRHLDVEGRLTQGLTSSIWRRESVTCIKRGEQGRKQLIRVPFIAEPHYENKTSERFLKDLVRIPLTFRLQLSLDPTGEGV